MDRKQIIFLNERFKIFHGSFAKRIGDVFDVFINRVVLGAAREEEEAKARKANKEN